MTTAFYSHPDCRGHDMGEGHPECPERLDAIDDHLRATGLDIALDRRDAPLASAADLDRAHERRYVAEIGDVLQRIAADGRPRAIDADTIAAPGTWQAVMRAAGAAVAATDAVIDGEVENAFCAVRPPGHHATPESPMGFCLFNNVAIAARRALDVHGLERVAIIDFDVHHGNGTAASFHDDPRVLMASFFQHPFYPYTDPEPITATSINVPVPAYTGGDVVRKLVTEQWLPALHAFRPQMIFISAGFDAHKEDDMGGMALVEADYAWITHQVADIARRYAGGRIVSCLEGGYALSALGRSVVAHVKALAELD